MAVKKTTQPSAQTTPPRPKKKPARQAAGTGSDTLQRAAAKPASLSAADILALQHTHGNRAVQRLLDESHPARRKTTVGLEGGEVSPELQSRIEQAQGSGRPLDPQVGAQIGQSLGADFSGVRVHTDSQADTLNRSLSAKAFTLGNDIFFSQGAYNPGASSRQGLLAHELTHVAQQGGGQANNKAQTKLQVGPAHDRFEQEADRVARGVSDGRIKSKAQPASGIQRYTAATNKYTLDHGQEDTPMFTAHSQDPALQDDDTIKHTLRETSARKKVFFAGDYSLAIQRASGKEAKEFYALPGVVGSANLKLKTKGSAVELEAVSGNTITPPDTEEKEKRPALQMVRPKIAPRGKKEKVGGAHAHFGTHICIEVAQLVFGNLQANYATQALLKKPGSSKIRKVNFSPDAFGAKEVYAIADKLADDSEAPTPKSVQEAALKVSKSLKNSGLEYSTKLTSKELEEHAKAIGANQFAKAEVGEGYASFSTRAGGGKGGHSWGYHYAGVVAESSDRADQVTLENYNRGGDIKREQEALFNKIVKDNMEGLQKAYDELDNKYKAIVDRQKGFWYKFSFKKTKDKDTKELNQLGDQKRELKDALDKKFRLSALKEAWLALHKNEFKDRPEAEQAYQRATMPDPQKRWFFKMYGEGADQSFHEQSAASGFFNAPVTLRVGKQED